MTAKQEQKEKSYAAIVASAATLLRERGIEASSVADVMKGAGLTVGGFYNHFASKEDLFATTIRTTANAMWNRLLARAKDKGASARARARYVITRYASALHRDRPEQGCVLPNAAPEIARDGEPYRTALAGELAGFIDSFAELLGGPDRRDTSLALIAMIYGALSLSRAVAGTKLSDDLLAAANAAGDVVLAAAHISDKPST